MQRSYFIRQGAQTVRDKSCLGDAEGNQSAAARMLGISRYALRYRMEKHGLN